MKQEEPSYLSPGLERGWDLAGHSFLFIRAADPNAPPQPEPPALAASLHDVRSHGSFVLDLRRAACLGFNFICPPKTA